MNFNLISPPGKADNFTINFRDPIKIKPNSKIDLNWIELKRNGEIVLEENGTITFTSTKCLPDKIPNDSSPNSIGFTVQIPAGVYELSEFQDLIETAVNNDLPDKIEQDYVAIPVNGNQSGATDLQNDGKVGLVLSTTFLGEPGLDAVNIHDAEQTTTGGDEVFYTTHNNTGTYDNYANTDVHFDCYRGECNSTLGNQLEYGGIAIAESISTIDNQTGKITFALCGLEFTDGIAPPPTRTTGDNPPVLKSGVPSSWILVETGGNTDDLIIYAAGRANDDINTWTQQNYEIEEMRIIHRVPMSQTFNTTDKTKLLFQLMLDTTNEDSPEFRFKLYNNQEPDIKLIYDSKPERRNLPFKLTIGDGITYDNATAINSQLPFGFQFSAQNQDEGWAKFVMSRMDKDDGTRSDTNPLTIMRDYQMTFSDNLAEALSVGNAGVTGDLYPNVCPPDATSLNVHETDLDLNWKAKNYSVFINLPCNNYKNVEQQSSGGFKKSILANLPSPFTTGTVIAQSGTDTGQVISIYQPYLPITSHLENNEINTNSFEIKIVDMKTEQLAEELNSSIVNFTIRDN